MTTPASPEGQAGPRVKTRRVHFLGGFDPRGARHYHRLYREEAAKQAVLTGAAYEVGDRRRVSGKVSGWNVSSTTQGESVATDFQFMGWDDIVRGDWDNSRWKLLWRGLRYYVCYGLDGGFRRVGQVSKGAYYTSLLPLFYLLTLGEVLITLAAIMVWLGWILDLHWIGLAAVAEAVALMAYYGVRLGEKLGTLWVLRSCVFTYEWGLKSPPEIEQRAEEMAEHILREQAAKPVDEVLIIGHSSGTFIAVPVVARIVEKSAHQPPPQLKLLTLGQCIPYLSIIPQAETFRRDLALLAGTSIPWTDASAGADIMCFYKVDPVRTMQLPTPYPDRPRLASVRVIEMFATDVYKKMRRDFVRVHFQYMMAGDRINPYDFFQITAGPLTLESRSFDSPVEAK